MALELKWDPGNAAANSGKHQDVTFEETMTAFAGPLGGVIDEPDHSMGELRLVLTACGIRSAPPRSHLRRR